MSRVEEQPDEEETKDDLTPSFIPPLLGTRFSSSTGVTSECNVILVLRCLCLSVHAHGKLPTAEACELSIKW